MKTYITNIINQVSEFSQKQEENVNLINFHWVLINESNIKKVFIFRKNQELLVSLGGQVERGKWEDLGYNSFLLEFNEGSFLFKQEFIDDTVLALKLDSQNQYALFINETKFGEDLNSLVDLEKFLNNKYFNLSPKLNMGIIEKFIKTHFSLRLGSYDEFSFRFYNLHDVPVYKNNFSDRYFIKRNGKIKKFEDKYECIRFIESYVL